MNAIMGEIRQLEIEMKYDRRKKDTWARTVLHQACWIPSRTTRVDDVHGVMTNLERVFQYYVACNQLLGQFEAMSQMINMTKSRATKVAISLP